jgi:type VI secretion system secreted protein Hcp
MYKVVLLTLALAAITLANVSFISIEGTRQGDFYSADFTNNRTKLLAYSWGIKSPRDAATGLATGKRQHMPLIVRKRASASSVQATRALITNEILKKVVIEVYTGDSSNPLPTALIQKIILTNAALVDIAQEELGTGVSLSSTVDTMTFTYQKFRIENGRYAAEDDLLARI